MFILRTRPVPGKVLISQFSHAVAVHDKPASQTGNDDLRNQKLRRLLLSCLTASMASLLTPVFAAAQTTPMVRTTESANFADIPVNTMTHPSGLNPAQPTTHDAAGVKSTAKATKRSRQHKSHSSKKTRHPATQQALSEAQHATTPTLPTDTALANGMNPSTASAVRSPDESAPEATPAVIFLPTVTPTVEWIDDKHDTIGELLQRRAHKINSWFGDLSPEEPKANVRVILDHFWDAELGDTTTLRIRGSLKLPNANKRLKLVFGDDSLDYENQQVSPQDTPGNQNQPVKAGTSTTTRLDRLKTQAKEDNTSLALRYLGINTHNLDTSFDVGIRSSSDIYARAKASKLWEINPDLDTRLTQTLRYGTDSKAFSQTSFLVSHHPKNQYLTQAETTLTYSEPSKALGMVWEHRIWQYHQLFAQNDFSYGWYFNGQIQDTDVSLNTQGPYVSWRQPFWRDWFFVRGDLNYFNNRPLQLGHHLSALVRLEAIF